MSTELKLRRGTPLEHGNFTGANGEVTVDTVNKDLRVHDGAEAGGYSASQGNKVNSLKDLENVILEDNAVYEVGSYYSGIENGGGVFKYLDGLDKNKHNGVTVFSPEALTSWIGTPSTVNTMLSWVGTGTGCFVRVMDSVLYASYAGIVPNVDCGANILALEKTVNEGAFTELHFTTDVITSEHLTIHKSIELDFHNNEVLHTSGETSKARSVVEIAGSFDITKQAVLTADTDSYQPEVTLNSVEPFEIGDWVGSTFDTSELSQEDYYPEAVHFIAKIIDIDSNNKKLILDLGHYFGFSQGPVIPKDVSTGSTQRVIVKANPLVKPVVKNLIAKTDQQSNERVSAVTLWCCDSPELKNVTGSGLSSHTAFIIGCRNATTYNLTVDRPLRTDAGRGYGVQEWGSHGSRHFSMKGLSPRHLHDASYFSSDIVVRDSVSYESSNYGFGCHTMQVADIVFDNCTDLTYTQGANGGGFNTGNVDAGTASFGSLVGPVTYRNCKSYGPAAKFFAAPLDNTETSLESCSLFGTNEAYGVRITAGASLSNCDFGSTRTRVYDRGGSGKRAVSMKDVTCSSIYGDGENTRLRNLRLENCNTGPVVYIDDIKINNSSIKNNGGVQFLGIDSLSIINSSIVSETDIINIPDSINSAYLSNVDFTETFSTVRFRAKNAVMKDIPSFIPVSVDIGGSATGRYLNISNCNMESLTGGFDTSGDIKLLGNFIDSYSASVPSGVRSAVITGNTYRLGSLPTASTSVIVSGNVKI